MSRFSALIEQYQPLIGSGFSWFVFLCIIVMSFNTAMPQTFNNFTAYLEEQSAGGRRSTITSIVVHVLYMFMTTIAIAGTITLTVLAGLLCIVITCKHAPTRIKMFALKHLSPLRIFSPLLSPATHGVHMAIWGLVIACTAILPVVFTLKQSDLGPGEEDQKRLYCKVVYISTNAAIMILFAYVIFVLTSLVQCLLSTIQVSRL
jgi:hypothetical protein